MHTVLQDPSRILDIDTGSRSLHKINPHSRYLYLITTEGKPVKLVCSHDSGITCYEMLTLMATGPLVHDVVSSKDRMIENSFNSFPIVAWEVNVSNEPQR